MGIFCTVVLRMKIQEFVETAREAGLEVLSIEHMHFWPARLALAYLGWPRWVTAPLYHFGQGVLRVVFRARHMGDYQLFRLHRVRPARQRA